MGQKAGTRLGLDSQPLSGQAVPGLTLIPSRGPFITQAWGRVHGNPRLFVHIRSLLLWPSGSITQEGTGTLRSPLSQSTHANSIFREQQ